MVNIDYQTGLISFTVGSEFTIAQGDTYSITGVEDINNPNIHRIKMAMEYIMVTSDPDMLIAENNLMTIAAMQKSIKQNPQKLIGEKLTELYTKKINKGLVNCIKSMWNDTDTSYLIDTQKICNSNLDESSKLFEFISELSNLNCELTKRSVGGIRATAYIVGGHVCHWFRKLVRTGDFVDNTGEGYPNSDLIGWYRDIPVLRHDDIDANDGFAIHKPSDGMLAPLMRGSYLPLTNKPVIGQLMPKQPANGVYCQENIVPLAPKLIQKFSINA